MGTAATRVALVIVAALAAAWLAVGIRALDLESEASSRSADLAEVRSDLDALRSARFLSADKTPLMNEGLLLYATGRRAEGIAAERRLVAQEPDNLDAWLALVYMYSTSRDTKQAARALRRVRTLNPLAQERLTDVRP
jgi:hypothetical protein